MYDEIVIKIGTVNFACRSVLNAKTLNLHTKGGLEHTITPGDQNEPFQFFKCYRISRTPCKNIAG